VKKTTSSGTSGHFISAKKTANDIRTSRAGASDYFSKPIDMERLLSRIAQLIGPAARPLPNSADEGASDVLVQQRGFAESRARAQALILAGSVIAGDHRVEKPGQLLDFRVELRVKEQLPYVSRGGLKLEKALEQFALRLPVASAWTWELPRRVHRRAAAAWSAAGARRGRRLRTAPPEVARDPRVVVHERVNARELRLPEPAARPSRTSPSSHSGWCFGLAAALRPADAWACVLVKPQFEAGRAEVGKAASCATPS